MLPASPCAHCSARAARATATTVRRGTDRECWRPHAGADRRGRRCSTCASTSRASRLARSAPWRTCGASATSTSRAATSVEVIDLLVNPALARGDEIVAVPTLVRKLPEPIRKIIGDLSDTDQVLVGLQVRLWAVSPS